MRKNIEDTKAYHKNYIRKHYAENKEKYLASAKARKVKIVEFVRAAKQKPCADCNTEYPYYVMQFDHTGDDKLINLAHAASKGWSFARIQAEIDKCDIVCSNCHAIRTHTRFSGLMD